MFAHAIHAWLWTNSHLLRSSCKLTLLSFQSSHCQFLQNWTNRCYCQKRFQPKHWHKWWKVVSLRHQGHPSRIFAFQGRLLPSSTTLPEDSSPENWGFLIFWAQLLSILLKRCGERRCEFLQTDGRTWECSPWTIVYISYHFINYCLYFAGAKYIPI